MATLTTNMTELPASATPAAAATEVIQLADFEAIFLRFQGPITRFIAHSIRNREQAFDLTQDVFVKVYKSLLSGTVIPQVALVSWLYRIATNTVTDTLRRQHLITWLPLSLFNEGSGVGTGVGSTSRSTITMTLRTHDEEGERPEYLKTARSIQKQGGYDGAGFEERVADRQIIERVFWRMSPSYGVCLWLYEHAGLTCPEIAEMLHISVSATKMRLKRAREQFLTLYRRETRA
jgi:RNA polymerase sigma-70 factor (ECF subfamily)